MKKVLIATDDTKGSLAVLDVFRNQVKPPEEVILVNVQRPLGRSFMGNMVNEAEMATLRKMVKETELQEEMDKQSEKILSYYKKELQSDGLFRIKTVVRTGSPYEEILKVAEEEQADMMILGSNDKSALDRLLTGSVGKDVEKRACVPVVVAKTGGFSVKDAVGDLQEAYHNAR